MEIVRLCKWYLISLLEDTITARGDWSDTDIQLTVLVCPPFYSRTLIYWNNFTLLLVIEKKPVWFYHLFGKITESNLTDIVTKQESQTVNNSSLYSVYFLNFNLCVWLFQDLDFICMKGYICKYCKYFYKNHFFILYTKYLLFFS